MRRKKSLIVAIQLTSSSISFSIWRRSSSSIYNQAACSTTSTLVKFQTNKELFNLSLPFRGAGGLHSFRFRLLSTCNFIRSINKKNTKQSNKTADSEINSKFFIKYYRAKYNSNNWIYISINGCLLSW
jgi:hypothetical protein